MSTTAVTPKYAAWFRPPGGEWRKLLEAPSRSAAFEALLDETRRLSGDLTVTPIGERPDRVYVTRGAVGGRPVSAGLTVGANR